jgi:hypothetical protein
LGFRVAQTIAAGDINMAFFAVQVIDRKFAAVVGCETEDDAKKAMPAIKMVGKGARA